MVHIFSKSLTLLGAALIICCVFQQVNSQQQQQQTQPISSRAAFLRAQRAARAQQQQAQPQPQAPVNPPQPPASVASQQPKPAVAASVGNALETALQKPVKPAAVASAPTQVIQSQQGGNRTARTTDVFQGGEGYNIFVTNTCERELMHVNIKTSRAFYGVIHTRNQRSKPMCSVEGNGETEYNLDISHVLNEKDPAYCGAVRARKESPEDKDLLSVVLVVRVHRNIELSDDKFFLLNCTNRCRRPDCSNPNNAKLLTSDNSNERGRLLAPGDDQAEGRERETTTPTSGLGDESLLTKPKLQPNEECTIWKFPWVITLLWCLGILLLAMIISHCIMCSSMVCRCVRTEVEEREPSVYEGATDDEDSLYNKRQHPMRIDYDNRDIYKTSNNYAPYSLDEVQAKSRHSKSKRTAR